MNVKDQLGKNPFLEDDPRHEVWALISHVAMEDDAELRSQILKKDPTDIYETALDWFTGCFDRSAKIGTLSVWSYQAADDYNAALPSMIAEVLSTAREWCPRNIVTEDFLLDLRVRLLQRQAHWENQALRYAREVQAGNRAKQHGNAEEASKPRSDGQGGSETLPKPSAAGRTSSMQRGPVANYDDRSLGTKAEPSKILKVPGRVGSADRRHGFKADTERHNAIAAVVGRYDEHWKNRSQAWRTDPLLVSVCADLDQAEIDIPGSWRSGKTPSLNGSKLKNWGDALELGYKRLVTDNIHYSLDVILKKTK